MEMTQGLFKLTLLENGFKNVKYDDYQEPNSIYKINCEQSVVTIYKNNNRLFSINLDVENFDKIIQVYFPNIKFDKKILEKSEAYTNIVKCQLLQIAKVDRNYIQAIINNLNKWYKNEFAI